MRAATTAGPGSGGPPRGPVSAIPPDAAQVTNATGSSASARAATPSPVRRSVPSWFSAADKGRPGVTARTVSVLGRPVTIRAEAALDWGLVDELTDG